MFRKLKWVEASALRYSDIIPQEEWDRHKEDICTKSGEMSRKDLADWMRNHRGFNAR